MKQTFPFYTFFSVCYVLTSGIAQSAVNRQLIRQLETVSDLVFVVQTKIQFLALFGQLVTVGLAKHMLHCLLWFSQRTPGQMFFLFFAAKGVAVQEYDKYCEGIKL